MEMNAAPAKRDGERDATAEKSRVPARRMPRQAPTAGSIPTALPKSRQKLEKSWQSPVHLANLTPHRPHKIYRSTKWHTFG
jgi:hypothetical protein